MARSTLLAALLLALPAAAHGAVQVITASLPPATVGQTYEASLDAENGDAQSYSWQVPGLPPGLELQNGTRGKISGVPTVFGTYQLTVMVSDGSGASDTASLNLEVKPSGPAPLPEAVRGEAYSSSVQMEGGMPPVSYTLASGTLPQHLTLSNDGKMTGMVDVTAKLGKYTFVVLAQDAVNHTASRSLTVEVVEAPPPHTIVDPAPKGGCSSGGGASWLGLLALAALRRRC